jgi:Bacterial Ig-like domain
VRNRIRTALITVLTLLASQLAVAPVGAVVAPPKVVIIVGPTGAQTDSYRSKGDDIAAVAEAAGATVVKVYSPNATWAAVKAAVDGANIVLYLGHGNGYPNPYTSGSEPTDRDNGWGLNRTTSGGDSDDWSKYMVYCGEKALLGTLTSASAAQWSYCGGSTNTDGINPAPNWVMIYSNACYAPGASEGWDTPATEPVAMQRVRNYSYPPLVLGAGAYFATDMGASGIIDDILRNPDMAFGAIAEDAWGYDLASQRHFDHPDLSGKRIWIQNTGAPDSGDYFYAYAGNPALTPSGATVDYTEPAPLTPPSVVYGSPAAGASGVDASTAVSVRFSEPVSGVGSWSMALGNVVGLVKVPATVSYDPDTWTATLVPSAPLAAGATYRLSMSGRITDLDGYPLPWTWWTFSTAGGTAPATSPTTFSPAVLATFRMGTQTGYKFSSSGVLLAVKTFTLTHDSGAYTTARAAISKQSGLWLAISSGVWAGYWVRESSEVYVASDPISAPSTPNATFSPAARLAFKMGTYTGYKFSSSGAMTAQKTFTLTHDSAAYTTARKAISHQSGTWFYVSSGVWAGYWLRGSDLVSLSP